MNDTALVSKVFQDQTTFFTANTLPFKNYLKLSLEYSIYIENFTAEEKEKNVIYKYHFPISFK
jgi:hypothetical protein